MFLYFKESDGEYLKTFEAVEIFTDAMQINDDITDMYACIYILQTQPIDLS